MLPGFIACFFTLPRTFLSSCYNENNALNSVMSGIKMQHKRPYYKQAFPPQKERRKHAEERMKQILNMPFSSLTTF